jgi:pimeloyl-ACP methyl ester carboxylesterase
METKLTRNQIQKRKAFVTKRLYEICRSSGENEKVEIESLRKELEYLEAKWLESSDAEEPTQESYVPPGVTERMPLLVLLHGQGWTGGSQIELWQPIAEREQIALLAPTSLSGIRDWSHRNDYRTLIGKIDQAVNTMLIDYLRIYLVGHSMGGKQALRIGLCHPDLFAAVALHSPTPDYDIHRGGFPLSYRRLPMRVWAGSDHEHDPNRTFAELLEIHFREHPELRVDLETKLLDRHRHSDYNIREGLLDEMWLFLKDKSLSQPPGSTPSAPQPN